MASWKLIRTEGPEITFEASTVSTDGHGNLVAVRNNGAAGPGEVVAIFARDSWDSVQQQTDKA